MFFNKYLNEKEEEVFKTIERLFFRTNKWFIPVSLVYKSLPEWYLTRKEFEKIIKSLKRKKMIKFLEINKKSNVSIF